MWGVRGGGGGGGLYIQVGATGSGRLKWWENGDYRYVSETGFGGRGVTVDRLGPRT